ACCLRAGGKRHAGSAGVLNSGVPRLAHALATLLTPVLDGRADVGVPLEAIVVLAPAEHRPPPASLNAADIGIPSTDGREAGAESWRAWDGESTSRSSSGPQADSREFDRRQRQS